MHNNQNHRKVRMRHERVHKGTVLGTKYNRSMYSMVFMSSVMFGYFNISAAVRPHHQAISGQAQKGAICSE